MSQAPATGPERAAPATRLPRITEAARTRSRLTLVAPTRGEAPLAPFVALLFVLLIGGVAGLLALNTSMQSSSFTATRLGTTATALAAKQQSLQLDLADLKDPQALAVRAKALGMVSPTTSGFLRLSDNKILGDPQPATAADAMRIDPLPVHKPRLLAPPPEIVKVGHRLPRGTDRPVRSVTHDRTGTNETSTNESGTNATAPGGRANGGR